MRNEGMQHVAYILGSRRSQKGTLLVPGGVGCPESRERCAMLEMCSMYIAVKTQEVLWPHQGPLQLALFMQALLSSVSSGNEKW